MLTLYANIYDLGMNPVVGAKLVVTPSGEPTIVDQSILISNKAIIGLTNINGYASVDIIGSGVPIRIRVADANYDRFFISPGSGLYDITTLP